jgi:hypothetical protein
MMKTAVTRYDGLMRFLLVVVAALLIIAGAAFWVAGRAAGPVITITQPAKAVGTSGTFDVQIASPGGKFGRIDVELQQGSSRFPLFSLVPRTGDREAGGADRIRVTGPAGGGRFPRPGRRTLAVVATRPVLFGLRTRGTARRDFSVILAPPGSMVSMPLRQPRRPGSSSEVHAARRRVGVRVGDQFYPGFPAAGAGVPSADPSLKVAFFALLWSQDLNTTIELYARDEAGNEAVAGFDHRVFPKPLLRSQIVLTDSFLEKVVTEILGHAGSKSAARARTGCSFLLINRELRQNADQIVAIASHTSPSMLFKGPFLQLGNSRSNRSSPTTAPTYQGGRSTSRSTSASTWRSRPTCRPRGNNGIVLLPITSASAGTA